MERTSNHNQQFWHPMISECTLDCKDGEPKRSGSQYVMSRFHDGKLWLDNPIEIIEHLIHHVTRLPRTGEKFPMDMPTAKMV